MEIYLWLVAGLVALVIGGDFLVRGAVNIAGRIGISPLLIGITLVGFGTSTPELVTSLQAAFIGSPGVAIGNVVGSNIANILLILGASALITPILVSKGAFKRDGLALAIASMLCLGVVASGKLSPLAGIGFIAVLIAYLVFSVLQERRQAHLTGDGEAAASVPAHSVWTDLAYFAAGLVLTIIGARWLVNSAVDLATRFGISETIIGLTIVAIGTSLPELVTSITAAMRKQGDIAFGNIVGSNIFNILFILGITSLVRPLQIPPEIGMFDIWVMLAATLAMIVMAISNWRITRIEGAILFGGYIAYTTWLVFKVTAQMAT